MTEPTPQNIKIPPPRKGSSSDSIRGSSNATSTAPSLRPREKSVYEKEKLCLDVASINIPQSAVGVKPPKPCESGAGIASLNRANRVGATPESSVPSPAYSQVTAVPPPSTQSGGSRFSEARGQHRTKSAERSRPLLGATSPISSSPGLFYLDTRPFGKTTHVSDSNWIQFIAPREAPARNADRSPSLLDICIGSDEMAHLLLHRGKKSQLYNFCETSERKPTETGVSPSLAEIAIRVALGEHFESEFMPDLPTESQQKNSLFSPFLFGNHNISGGTASSPTSSPSPLRRTPRHFTSSTYNTESCSTICLSSATPDREYKETPCGLNSSFVQGQEERQFEYEGKSRQGGFWDSKLQEFERENYTAGPPSWSILVEEPVTYRRGNTEASIKRIDSNSQRNKNKLVKSTEF